MKYWKLRGQKLKSKSAPSEANQITEKISCGLKKKSPTATKKMGGGGSSCAT